MDFFSPEAVSPIPKVPKWQDPTDPQTNYYIQQQNQREQAARNVPLPVMRQQLPKKKALPAPSPTGLPSYDQFVREVQARMPGKFNEQQLRQLYQRGTDKKSAPVVKTSQKTVAGARVMPNASKLEQIIRLGLEKYGNPPIATRSASLAKAGEGLPDPLLPTIVALAETSGGKKITKGDNNIYNILPGGLPNAYPDLDTAILGGNGRKGFSGLIRGGLYDDYLKSGRMEDFLKRYTPAGAEHGNASLEQQLRNYRVLRSYFE